MPGFRQSRRTGRSSPSWAPRVALADQYFAVLPGPAVMNDPFTASGEVNDSFMTLRFAGPAAPLTTLPGPCVKCREGALQLAPAGRRRGGPECWPSARASGAGGPVGLGARAAARPGPEPAGGRFD